MIVVLDNARERLEVANVEDMRKELSRFLPASLLQPDHRLVAMISAAKACVERCRGDLAAEARRASPSPRPGY